MSDELEMAFDSVKYWRALDLEVVFPDDGDSYGNTVRGLLLLANEIERLSKNEERIVPE